MSTATPSASPVVQAGAAANVDAPLSEARDRGLDLRRGLFVAYLVDMGSQRDDAFELWRHAMDDGWAASFYVDNCRWIVKLGRNERIRSQTLSYDRQYVDRLVSTYGGELRGSVVEDLAREDCWSELAADVSRRARAAPVLVPAQGVAATGEPRRPIPIPRTA